ncbi:hypothetical protein VPH35_044539 [Triticum aestivum]
MFGLWMQSALDACSVWPSFRVLSWLVGVGVVLGVGISVSAVAIVLFYLLPCIFLSVLLCISSISWCLCNPSRLMTLLIQSRARFELFSGSAGAFSLKKGVEGRQQAGAAR